MSKVGVDDYLAAGGAVAELKALARRFEPQDLGRIKLSRNAKLRAAVKALWSQWWDFEWSRLVGTGERPNSARGHSCRDAMKAAIDTASTSGKVVEDGVRFTLSARTWALRAATSKTTILKTIDHMEAEGQLRRDYEGKKKGEAGSYVLLVGRANLDQVGRKDEEEGSAKEGFGPGGQGLRAPRLRWSAPTFDRDGDRIVRGYIHRLGKIDGAVIDVLDKEGAAVHGNELAAALNRRPRDLRRRNLPRLEKAGIIIITGDMVALTEDWQEALRRERELKGEIEATERDREKYRRHREAFRNRNNSKVDYHPANVGADGFIEDLRPFAEQPEGDLLEPEVSPLARAIRDYLERSPHDACQPPGWIAVTLWAYELYSGKPTPAEVRTAIEELGGEQYLTDRLRCASGAA